MELIIVSLTLKLLKEFLGENFVGINFYEKYFTKLTQKLLTKSSQ
jgi:hypothetical protein